MPASSSNFDRIARPYRWLEYLSFGPMLERCRFYRIPQLTGAHRALVLGDGDGRFLARLLAYNPEVQVDAVDQSAAMLRLLVSRASAVGAGERVRTRRSDVLDFAPIGSYDLVVTHFFLDCFNTEDVQAIAEAIRPHLAPGGSWVMSEFAIPRGLLALPSRAIVAALYGAFRLITGLGVRALPDYAAALSRSGLVLEDRKSLLAGLLVSDVWKA